MLPVGLWGSCFFYKALPWRPMLICYLSTPAPTTGKGRELPSIRLQSKKLTKSIVPLREKVKCFSHYYSSLLLRKQRGVWHKRAYVDKKNGKCYNLFFSIKNKVFFNTCLLRLRRCSLRSPDALLLPSPTIPLTAYYGYIGGLGYRHRYGYLLAVCHCRFCHSTKFACKLKKKENKYHTPLPARDTLQKSPQDEKTQIKPVERFFCFIWYVSRIRPKTAHSGENSHGFLGIERRAPGVCLCLVGTSNCFPISEKRGYGGCFGGVIFFSSRLSH